MSILSSGNNSLIVSEGTRVIPKAEFANTK